MKNLNKPIVMDFDDLCDATMSKLKFVCELKYKMPSLKVTLFTIPTKISDENIAKVKHLGDWIALGMHGWRHTTGECWSWTSEEAEDKMRQALERGIDGRVFRAPKWLIDVETYKAAKALDWVIADHKDFRILGSGTRTYTYNQPLRDPPVTRVHGHLPNVSGNGIEEFFSTFVFDPDRTFKHITELA